MKGYQRYAGYGVMIYNLYVIGRAVLASQRANGPTLPLAACQVRQERCRRGCRFQVIGKGRDEKAATFRPYSVLNAAERFQKHAFPAGHSLPNHPLGIWGVVFPNTQTRFILPYEASLMSRNPFCFGLPLHTCSRPCSYLPFVVAFRRPHRGLSPPGSSPCQTPIDSAASAKVLPCYLRSETPPWIFVSGQTNDVHHGSGRLTILHGAPGAPF